MIEYLKSLWLRVVNPKFALALEERIQTLEKEIKEMREKRLLPVPVKAEDQEEVRPRLPKPWGQRRAYLEITDGGRLTKTRDS